MTPEMEKYGFADNFSPGDLIGHTLGGYSYDHITAGSAINWLRTKGRPLGRRRQAVVHVRELRQSARHHVLQHRCAGREGPGHRQAPPARRPRARACALQGDVGRAGPGQPAPAVRRAGPARRRTASSTTSGTTSSATCRSRTRAGSASTTTTSTASATSTVRSRRCSPSSQALRLDREHDRGLHLRPRRDGRRPRPARQGTVRLQRDARTCRSTSSIPTSTAASSASHCRGHIDLVPTLLSMAGVKPDRAAELAGRALPGKDSSPLLGQSRQPARSMLLARRRCSPTAGLASNDSGVFDFAAKAVMAGKDPKEEAKQAGLQARPQEARPCALGLRRPLPLHSLFRAGRPQQPGDARRALQMERRGALRPRRAIRAR